jgi:serine/threonine-protein kinase
MAGDTDRNLLFGVLALQAGLLDANQFAEACSAWAARKDRPLAGLLVERGLLTAGDRALVDSLLERTVHRHAGDARASLLAVTRGEVRQALAGVTDSDVQKSVAALPPPDGVTPTVAYEPGGRGRYTLTRLHAAGGIGRVWVARDEDLGREVALKELLPERAGNEFVAARFVEEARITGQLEHPGVVPVYELSRRGGGGQPFYTMRLLRGRTLGDAVKAYHRRREAGEAGPLALRDLLTSFVAVCNAVAYAHSRGVLHRDLKPGNVVLGDYGEAVVLDWGLAKARGSADGRTGLTPVAPEPGASRDATLQGQVLGTPAYMAPEQAEGRLEAIDERSDVYGLGAVLYEILTGRPPFAGPDTAAVLGQVVGDAPAPPRLKVPATPRALEAVCLKALAKRPEDRYASAKELAEEVRHWLADESVRAYPEPWAARARRWLGRHRTLATAAAAAVAVAALSLGAATALLTAANDRERRARQAEQEAAGRERLARERAEEDFRLARAAVDRGLTKVSESPELKVRGLEKLRRELLSQAKDFYEQFVRGRADDPALQAERARAYLRLAAITEETGDRPQAIAFAKQAVALFDSLAQADPSAAGPADSLAEALTALGRYSHGAGQHPAAQAALERAADVAGRLTAEHPGVPDYRLRLAVALNGLGLLRVRALGQLPQGEADLERARSLCEQLAGEQPDRPEYQSERARALVNLAQRHASGGDEARAAEFQEQAAALLEGLVRQNPTAVAFQERLLSTLNSLVTTYSNLRRGREEARSLARALPLAERLVREHPDVPRYRDLLGDLRRSAAASFAWRGDYHRYAEEVEAALRISPAGGNLYNTACSYCLRSTEVRRDARVPPAERDALAARFLGRAMECLLAARHEGLFKEAYTATLLKTDKDLDALRSREDFRQLLRDVEKEAGGMK